MRDVSTLWRPMRPTTRAVAVILLVAMAAALGGCGQQSQYERNAALSRQYEDVYRRNLEQERRIADLERQIQEAQAAPSYPEPLPAIDTTPPPRTRTVVETVPEPVMAPDFGDDVGVVVTGDTMTVTVSDQVLFSSGSATLRSASKQVLDNVASVLRREYPTHRIRVEGHTDNEPIRKTKHLWKDNWELSYARAKSVAEYLASKGIEPGRIRTAGFGETRPVASNATSTGKAKNRRVEIIVSPR